MKQKQLSKIILTAIIFLNILLRLPALLEPVYYGDECIYLTLGQALNKGLVFYRDIHDNKPPLLYLIASLAGANQANFRLIMIAWNSLNVFIIYLLAKKVLKNTKAGLFAAGLFAYFSLLPEGRIANGEIFMIMPATLGVFLILEAVNKKKSYFFGGLLFALAFLFKVPVGFDFAGLILTIFVYYKTNRKIKPKKLKEIPAFLKDQKFYFLLIGFVIPIIISIIYYSLKGAFTPYVRSALMQNIGYLSSWGGSNSGLFIRAGILLAISFLIYGWRKKLGFNFVLFSLLGFWGLYGVYLPQRPYPHYYIEIVPWAVLMLTILFQQKKLKQLIIVLIFLGSIRAGYKYYNFWWYPHLSYYKNFISYAAGRINKDQYYQFFGDKVLDDYQIAYFLQKETLPNERVFIWGDGACIYALSQRLPPGRYTVNYHIYDFNGFQETIDAILQKQPKIIVKLLSEKSDFPKLDATIANFYTKIFSSETANIYKKAGSF